MHRTKAINNETTIKYNIDQLNSLVSMVLSSCVEQGELTLQECNSAKQVFNTLIDIVVNHEDEADQFLEDLESWKTEYGIAINSDDPIAVAQKMAAQATELYNSEHNYEKNRDALKECPPSEDNKDNDLEVLS